MVHEDTKRSPFERVTRTTTNRRWWWYEEEKGWRRDVWHNPQFTNKLQVDGFLYRVHLYFFCRDSVYFSTRFAQLGVRGHEASSIIVSLGDVECKDFEAFLSVLYPQ